MNIVRPDFVFGVIAVDDHIGSAAVAPVEDHYAITAGGDLLGLKLDAADVAPASWG